MNISNVSNETASHPQTKQVGGVNQQVKKVSKATETNYDSEKINPNQKKQVKNTVEKLNDFFDPVKTNLKFVYHEDLHEYYVTVINPLTDEVVREIPPKKILDMVAKMTEFIGVLVDEKA